MRFTRAVLGGVVVTGLVLSSPSAAMADRWGGESTSTSTQTTSSSSSGSSASGRGGSINGYYNSDGSVTTTWNSPPASSGRGGSINGYYNSDGTPTANSTSSGGSTTTLSTPYGQLVTRYEATGATSAVLYANRVGYTTGPGLTPGAVYRAGVDARTFEQTLDRQRAYASDRLNSLRGVVGPDGQEDNAFFIRFNRADDPDYSAYQLFAYQHDMMATDAGQQVATAAEYAFANSLSATVGMAVTMVTGDPVAGARAAASVFAVCGFTVQSTYGPVPAIPNVPTPARVTGQLSGAVVASAGGATAVYSPGGAVSLTRTTGQQNLTQSDWTTRVVPTAPNRFYYVLTGPSGSGRIELHDATLASGWSKPSVQTPTFVSSADAANGSFQMLGSTLYFIKTRATATGRVEVHAASATKGYRQPTLQVVTGVTEAEAANGRLQMVRSVEGDQLALVKTRGTGSGTVEVHLLGPKDGYRTFTGHYTSDFSVADTVNGIFAMDGVRKLTFVKTRQTGTGAVELHVSTLSPAGRYLRTLATRTWIAPSQAGPGSVLQVLDGRLYLILTRSTGSGKVEIHATDETSGYQTPSLQTPTPYPTTSPTGTFQMGSS